MTVDWIVDRFDEIVHQPQKFSGCADAFVSYRGDHNLNQDMQPKLQSDGSLRSAAVLIPIVDRPRGPTVLLTQRTDHLTHHPGQVCFPGGRVEPSDAGPEHTALRETQEELGLSGECIRPLAQLDDYLTRTGFVVTPVVAIVSPPFRLQPDPVEVADVFEVPLAFLIDPENHRRHSRRFEGRERFYYAMPYNDRLIWGATAGMLINLFQVLKP